MPKTGNDSNNSIRCDSVRFQNLEEIGDAYEIETRKHQVEINRPSQMGITVYQMAKLRVLQFYYHCVYKFLDRRDFELIQMGTDSLYFGLSCDLVEETVRPEMLEEFLACNKWHKWSEREPGCLSWSSRAFANCSVQQVLLHGRQE